MLAGMTIPEAAPWRQLKSRYRPPWRQRFICQAYATSESDGVCARGRLSGTGFSDDEDDHLVVLHDSTTLTGD